MNAIVKTVGVALAALALAGSALAAETYSFDKGHTEIIFKWNHVGMTTQSGEFRDFDGTVVIDRENIENSKVDVVIKTASMDTGVTALDDDLKSENFFEVEKFPEITFKSTSVKQSGVNRAAVTGNLTIRGVAKPVTLDTQLNFDGDHPLAPFFESYAGAPYVAFSGRTEILRSEFDVGRAVPLVSDRIEIVIETELRQQSN